MLLQHIPERRQGTGPAVLDDGVLSLQLAHRAVKHLVRHRIGEENHQIRAADLVPQSSPGFGEDLRLTLVVFTQFLIAAFHTFIAAHDHDAHGDLLSA